MRDVFGANGGLNELKGQHGDHDERQLPALVEQHITAVDDLGEGRGEVRDDIADGAHLVRVGGEVRNESTRGGAVKVRHFLGETGCEFGRTREEEM